MKIGFNNCDFHYCFINLNCLTITWVFIKNAKCWFQPQDVNLKMETGCIYDNQVPWRFRSPSSPDSKLWSLKCNENKQINPLLYKKTLMHCT